MRFFKPNFNAPIPAFASLNFLFYRWGFNSLEIINNSMAFFESQLWTYLEEDNLDFYYKFYYQFDNYELFSSNIERPLVSIGHSLLEPKTESELEKLGFKRFCTENDFLYLKADIGFIWADDYTEISMLEHDNKKLHTFFEEETKEGSGFKYGYLMANYDEIYLERNQLKAFEQKTGFVNHGLTIEQLDQYLDINSKDARSSNRNNLEAHNQQRALSEQDYIDTVCYFREVREKNKTWLKGSTFEAVSELLEKKNGKRITGKSVEKRLKKAESKGLIDKNELIFHRS